MAQTEKDVKRLEAFDKTIEMLNKKYRQNDEVFVAKLGDEPRSVETFSTGSLVLDHALGGGFPVGRIVEIYGPESSGKTSIALNAIANVQKNGGTAVFIDLEQALDPKYAKTLGVNIEALPVSQPDYAEQALDFLKDLVDSGAVDLVVFDSVAALTTRDEIEGSVGDQTIGLIARLLSKTLKGLISSARKNKTTIIFINQLRDAIRTWSPTGKAETTTGGRAMKFYASQRIDIRRREQIKDDKTVIGNRVKMKVVKNKIAPPFREGETILSFNKGINRAAELMEVAPKFNVLRLEGRSYFDTTLPDEPKIATSKADALEAIEKDDALAERLSEALKKRMKGEANVSFSEVEESEPLPIDDED